MSTGQGVPGIGLLSPGVTNSGYPAGKLCRSCIPCNTPFHGGSVHRGTRMQADVLSGVLALTCRQCLTNFLTLRKGAFTHTCWSARLSTCRNELAGEHQLSHKAFEPSALQHASKVKGLDRLCTSWNSACPMVRHSGETSCTVAKPVACWSVRVTGCCTGPSSLTASSASAGTAALCPSRCRRRFHPRGRRARP